MYVVFSVEVGEHGKKTNEINNPNDIARLCTEPTNPEPGSQET